MPARAQIAELIRGELTDRAGRGMLRDLVPCPGSVDFCSNDYLGLARSGAPQAALPSLGATGSRLISGGSELHDRLERHAAQFHRAESALLFNSGYDANVGLLSALGSRGVTLLIDELAHASMHDGARLSFATVWKFAHNDLADLQAKLGRSSGATLVCVESLYSMEGDEAPLADLCKLCRQHQAALIVDEAHAGGIYGDAGRGIVARDGLEEQVFARVVTYGKAFGRHGAMVLGSTELRQFLINCARSFIYSTALPPASVAAIEASYDRITEADEERRKLFALIDLFVSEAERASLPRAAKSYSPIQGVLVPGNDRVTLAAQLLNEAGFAVKPIRAPTVAAGQERLRIVLHSFNTADEVRGVVQRLREIDF